MPEEEREVEESRMTTSEEEGEVGEECQPELIIKPKITWKDLPHIGIGGMQQEAALHTLLT